MEELWMLNMEDKFNPGWINVMGKKFDEIV